MMLRALALAVVLSCAAWPLALRADDFSGVIVDSGGSVPNRSTDRFTLHVDRYTTVEEAQALADILLQQGPDAVLKEIRKLTAGYIKIGDRLGYPVGVIRSIDTENGGRMIRAVTDRPLQMYELMRNTRSSTHEFGTLEIQLDEEGKGQGQLIAAAKVSINKAGEVVVESLGTRPFTLKNVKTKVPKEKGKKEGGT